MDSKEFFSLAARMRAKQNEYFSLRKAKGATAPETKQALSEALQLEKELDAEIERVRSLYQAQGKEIFW